jgi:hypothetical protein
VKLTRQKVRNDTRDMTPCTIEAHAQESSDLWVEQFEGNLAFVAAVVDEVDGRPATTPGLALDRVAVLELAPVEDAALTGGALRAGSAGR